VATKANALLDFLPKLFESPATQETRLAITRALFELYREVGAADALSLTEVMRLFAGLAFIILIIERQDNIPLWYHPPIRDINMGLVKQLFTMLMSAFDYDDYVRVFEEELKQQRTDVTEPLKRLFVVTVRCVQPCIIMAENGASRALVRAAFLNNEKAMRVFERRYELGSLPGMTLNVSRPGQVRYRNTVYLYGGNHLERIGEFDEAREWYLKDIDDTKLPENAGFYLTAFKTCERLLLGYRLTPSKEKPRLRGLIDETLRATFKNLGTYARDILNAIDDNPGIDITSPRIEPDGRMFLFGSEGVREPLLAALLYRNIVEGIPYADTDYALFQPK
jgi:hypothetical protein